MRNRIVTLEMMKDDLVDYFSNSNEVLGEVLWPEGGFFDGVTLAADGNDKFKIGGLSGVDGTVGGDLLNLTDRQADVEGIQFENTVVVDYHVGLRDARLPDPTTPNITVNPKDGLPNWTFFRHIVGNQDIPDVIVDNGDGTITFTVDTITEAGVSNAGRQVYVFMTTLPAGAITDAIAIELCTVAWDGSNNKITTVGKLGQATVSISKPAYTVILVGPHVLRNTDISTDTTYAYVGTVQGAGAGSPPTVFDVSGQRLLSASSSLLWQVTRVENVPPNRLKIDVKAIAGETGVNQIQVQSSAPAVVFSVDEAGNVVVEGNLEVKGTTTTRDVDQINTHNAYFDNFDAGNADTDTHNIQGEWTHRVGVTTVFFAIDGDTGKIGIGGTYDAAYALKVTGDSFYTGDLIPDATACLGAPAAYWCDIYATTYHIGSNLLPDVTASFDIGESGTPLKWKDLFLSGTAYADTGIDVASSAIVGDAVSLALSDIPFRISATGAGAAEKNWALEIASGANEVLTLATKSVTWGAGAAFFEAKRTVDSTVIELLTLTATETMLASLPRIETASPALRFKTTGAGTDEKNWAVEIFTSAKEYFDLATKTDAWGAGVSFFRAKRAIDSTTIEEIILTATEITIAGNLLPDLATRSLGGAAAGEKWKLFYLSILADEGVATDLVPATTALNLGNASYPWQKLFLSDAADEGVATDLVPATTALNLGNASYPWQKLFLSDAAGFGVGTSLIPDADVTHELGGASKRWKTFFLSSTQDQGVGTKFVPIDDNSFDIGTNTRQWKDGYFGGTVRGGQLRATTDVGGVATTTTFTNGTATGVGVNGSIGAAGGNSNVGFLVVYVGAGTMYVPYWDNITT